MYHTRALLPVIHFLPTYCTFPRIVHTRYILHKPGSLEAANDLLTIFLPHDVVAALTASSIYCVCDVFLDGVPEKHKSHISTSYYWVTLLTGITWYCLITKHKARY